MDRRKFIQLSSLVGTSLLAGTSAYAQNKKTTTTATKNNAKTSKPNMPMERRDEWQVLPSTPIWQWQARQVAQGLRTRKISSVEATKSVLKRIEATNKKYNALCYVLAEQALIAAKKADEMLARGNALSPLHGVPITIKNNTDVWGVPTTDGIVAYKEALPPANAALVDNLLQDGAVIVGVSNVPEFTFRWFTENPLFGRTLNPWNEALTCGGSSGGAASATTAGMGFIAHGSDIAGSIRYPAYVCGCVGLRPTPGRVPSFNPSSPNNKTFAAQMFTVQGPLARSVRDCRMGFHALAQATYLDPNSVRVCSEKDEHKKEKVPSSIIGMLLNYPGVSVQPEIIQNIKKTAKWLEQEGYRVEEIEIPELADAMDVWLRIVMTEVGQFMYPAVQKVGSKEVLNAVESMLANTPVIDIAQYMTAIATRNNLRRKVRELFQKYRAILLPVSTQSPMAWGEDLKGSEAMKQVMDIQSPMMATTTLGLPIISVPTGVRAGNIPEGVQIMADAFREDICFKVASAIERNAQMPFVFS